MNDDDTLDEPEEIIEQARQAAAEQETPDDDHTIPAEPTPGQQDETIPAQTSSSPSPAGDDDETIDADPELIRNLRQQRAQQQPEDADLTVPRPPTGPQPTAGKASTKRRTLIAALTLIAMAAAVLLSLWRTGVLEGDGDDDVEIVDPGEDPEESADDEPASETEEPEDDTAGPADDEPASETEEPEPAATEGPSDGTPTPPEPTVDGTACPDGSWESDFGCITECPNGTQIPVGKTCPTPPPNGPNFDKPSLPVLTVQDRTGRIQMRWTANNNGSSITSWNVNDGNLAGGPSSSATSYAWENVPPGNYIITVQACNAAGCGQTVQETVNVIQRPVVPRPVPPSPPVVTVQDRIGRIQISWTANDNGFPITRWFAGATGGPTPFGDPFPLSAEHSTESWDNALPGNYTITVNACNEAGCSETAQTVTVIDFPTQTSLNVTGGVHRITASWSANDNGSPITRWEVDDGNLSGGPSSTATSYTWSNVSPGTYTIAVRACNAAGCGQWAQRPATVTAPQPRVTISRGGDASSETVCAEKNWRCVYVRGTLTGFGEPPYTVYCWISGTRKERISWYGRGALCIVAEGSDQSVYVTVDGIRSNTITIP